ncbi:MAG TPA: phosphate signaling complex protein PhoU [Acidimicrobiales bacterium]
MTETRRSFHEELEQLRHDVIVLAAAAEEAIQAGTHALLDRDLTAVERVIADDRTIDDLTHSAEERCYELLARQQPMAVDLRTLVTVMRILHELERIGDLMVNVAKTTRRLFPGELEPRVRGIIDRMRDQASVQVRLAVDAFADRDPARAAALVDMDDVMDDLQKELFRTIFAGPADDDHALQRAVQVALVGRYFERIADHAVNVAERVEFMVTGQFGSPDRTARRA